MVYDLFSAFLGDSMGQMSDFRYVIVIAAYQYNFASEKD